MKNNFGTNARDAEASRKNARTDGERDGQRNFPPRDPDGNPTTDHAGRGNGSEADTTDAITKAGHFDGQRVEDDRHVGTTRANTARATTETTDARHGYEDVLAEQRAYEQSLPLSAKFGFWPKWVVHLLLALLGIGSGAAVTAALLQVTSDQTTLTYIIGGAVAIATVVGGAALGTLLRKRDLDSIKEGRYASSGRYTTGVIVLGVVGVIAIALGVAGLRHDASVADAARRADRTSVNIFVPGQKPTAGASSGVGTKPVPKPEGVNWPIWLALEIGIAAAATSIEFQRSDVRAEHKEQIDRRTGSNHATWKAAHAGLGNAVGEYERAIATRADHDLSVILTGSGQRSFADVLTNDYRHGNLGVRGQGGANPFEQSDAHVRLEIDTTFDTKPGVDVLALGNGELDPATITKLVATDRDLVLLDAAYRELSAVPSRPPRATTEPWVPGAYLASDPAAQALRKANATSEPEVDLNDARAKPVTTTVVSDAVPDSVPDNLLQQSNNGSGS